MYKLVEQNQIPKANMVEEADVVKAYKTAVGLSILCVKQEGIGLSAVQAGIPLHLFVIKNNLFSDHYGAGFSHFMNCRYEAVGEETYESWEGCLSLLDNQGRMRYFIVKRPKSIRLIGQKIIAGNPIRAEKFDQVIEMNSGSSVYAHEVDHGYGITIDKIGVEQIVKKNFRPSSK